MLTPLKDTPSNSHKHIRTTICITDELYHSIEDIVIFITMKMMSELVGITVRSVPSLEEL